MYTLLYSEVGNVHPLYTQVGMVHPLYTQVGMVHPMMVPWWVWYTL